MTPEEHIAAAERLTDLAETRVGSSLVGQYCRTAEVHLLIASVQRGNPISVVKTDD